MDKEKYILTGLFISMATFIFGAGVLYQKSENNSAQIEILLDREIRFSTRNLEDQKDIQYLAERIASLEAKIEALDSWCRNSLKTLLDRDSKKK